MRENWLVFTSGKTMRKSTLILVALVSNFISKDGYLWRKLCSMIFCLGFEGFSTECRLAEFADWQVYLREPCEQTQVSPNTAPNLWIRHKILPAIPTKSPTKAVNFGRDDGERYLASCVPALSNSMSGFSFRGNMRGMASSPIDGKTSSEKR